MAGHYITSTPIKRSMEIMGTPGGHVMVLGILDI
jgi:hypothetical protein